jgi:hypothetical protein
MAAGLFLPGRRGLSSNLRELSNGAASQRTVERHCEPDSGPDYGPRPRSRRACDCLGLELEKLGEFAPDVPEDGDQGRAAQHCQRNHGGSSDAEPEPHWHRDLIGIHGGR